jgi:cytochrome c5
MTFRTLLKQVGLAHRRRTGERRILRLAALGAGADLAALASESPLPSVRLLARGAYARWLFGENRLREASTEFLKTRSAVKETGARAGDYINLFCLCHLALIRGVPGYGDAARFARQARRSRGVGRSTRLALAVPALPERAFPGTEITFSVKPVERPVSTYTTQTPGRTGI